MEENTLELEIPLLIPGLSGHEDNCLERLETSLNNQRGILRAHVEYEKNPLVLCLHYNPDLTSIEDVRRIATRAGTSIANRYHHEVIPVEGMDCSDCVTVLEHSLKRIDGVLDVKASYTAQKIFVEFDSKTTNQKAIERRINDLGYLVPKEGARRWYLENRSLIFSLSAGLALLIGWSGEQFLSFPGELSLVFYLAAYLLAGWDTAIHAWHALKARTFDTDLLMIAAALGAAFLGEYAEGALLLFLFSLSHTLEDRILDRARGAIRGLADLAPKTAMIQREGTQIEIPVEELILGDVVVVRPGTRIPVDGRIISGASSVNQAPVTGESIPVDKTVTDKVYAGSLNGEGALEVQVTRLAKDSTLARVSQLVEQAQAGKSPTQLVTDRFMRWFVPAVLICRPAADLNPPSVWDSIQRIIYPCHGPAGSCFSLRTGIRNTGRHHGWCCPGCSQWSPG